MKPSISIHSFSVKAIQWHDLSVLRYSQCNYTHTHAHIILFSTLVVQILSLPKKRIINENGVQVCTSVNLLEESRFHSSARRFQFIDVRIQIIEWCE